MLREFTRSFRPISAAGLTARAVTASAVVLMLASLPGCGIKGPLKPAPPPAAAPTANVPPNPGAIPVKPAEPPTVTAPPIPAIVKP